MHCVVRCRWDVLCDMDSGKVLLGGATSGDKTRRVGVEPPRLSEADEEIYDALSAGMDLRYSEHWLRAVTHVLPSLSGYQLCR